MRNKKREKMPKCDLFRITCVVADDHNRPRYIATFGESKLLIHQELVTSSLAFDTAIISLRRKNRQLFVADTVSDPAHKTIYMYVTDPLLAYTIREELDKHFGIDTQTCIMIEQFSPMLFEMMSG